MKKNDLSKNSGENRGFWQVGHLENQDYLGRMLELTRRQIQPADLDNDIEKIRAEKKEKYFDQNFKETSEKNGIYTVFPTGQKAFRTNNDILAGFYRISSGERWRGVYLDQHMDSLGETLSSQRQRCPLEDYTYIYDYSHIARICNEHYQTKQGEDDWANHLGALFMKREKDGQVYKFDSGSYFPAEEPENGQPQMFFWMERNDKPGVKQKGFGLNLIDLEDLLEKWSESKYKFTLDRLVFGKWNDLEEFVEEVAENAMPENWGRISAPTPELSFGYPVLKSYLEYTLVRLRILDQRETGYLLREEDRIYYNTGLLNKFFRQILVGAELRSEVHNVPGIGQRTFEYFFNPFTIVTGHDTKFPTEHGRLLDLPKIANYFEKKEDVLYDASLEIMLNDEHIFEDGLKSGRIPMFKEEYQQVKNHPEEEKSLHIRVQARIQTAIQRAKLLAERNHKLAVPQFWKEDAEVQFLLPLYMEEAEYSKKPQCALALRRSKNGTYYEGATILSLDMAYNNARLIARPDLAWLNRADIGEDSEAKSAPKEIEKPPVTTAIVKVPEKRELMQIKEAPKPAPTPSQKKPVAKKIMPKKEMPKKEPVKKVIAKKDLAKKTEPKPVLKKQEKPKAPKEKILSSTIVESDFEEDETFSEILPNPKNIGSIAVLSDIVSRPSGKGLKGIVFGSSGTVARGLLKHSVPFYTNNVLKVKILDINPQGNQYILEPIETD